MHPSLTACAHALTQELNLSRAMLGDASIRQFTTSQWSPLHSTLLGYRILAALFALAVFCSILYFGDGLGHSTLLVFFTIWTYFTVTSYLLLSAVITLVFFMKENYPSLCVMELSTTSDNNARTASSEVRPVAITGHREKVSSQANHSDTSEKFPAQGNEAVLHTEQVLPQQDHTLQDSEQPLIQSEQVLIHHADTLARDQQASFNSTNCPLLPTSSELPHYVKAQWILLNVAAPNSFLVTLIYWSILFPSLAAAGFETNALDVCVHGLNSVLLFVELSLNAVPSRLVHYYHPFIYSLCYVLFSALYWGIDHSNVIYPNVLDWNHPAPTCAMLAGIVIVQALFHVLTFLIYKFKLYVASRL